MAAQLPKPRLTKAVVLRKSTAQQATTYHDALVEERPIPALKRNEILVKMSAAAFNRRDLWQRLGQYPGIGFGTAQGSDGVGKVISSSRDNDPLLHRRVFLNPLRGWDSHPETPERGIVTIGGSKEVDVGTFSEYVVVERDQVIPAPEHLDDIGAAAWPLAGLTAWRAAVVNGQVKEGDTVLVTGIGGGVAVVAMQFCIAKKANVYVSSSSEDKIKRAVSMGAQGGVDYKSKNWPTELATLMKKNGQKALDLIIDSGGGDIMGQAGKYVKPGGRVVVYGMTAHPKITFTMREVLRNQKLIGSTMGSHKDLEDATAFIAAHKLVPVVSHVLPGLDAVEEGFDLLRRGGQFGKIVIQIDGEARAKL